MNSSGLPARADQLRDIGDLKKKRVRGIEPLSLAWKAKVLPLNYTRRSNAVFGTSLIIA
jgi:hypothetical protein